MLDNGTLSADSDWNQNRPESLSKHLFLLLRPFESLMPGCEKNVPRQLLHGQDQIGAIAAEWEGGV
jgi:hypothetical protein